MIPFGSNLTFLDAKATQGYVATYHRNRSLAQANFSVMRANGQTLAKIFLAHWATDDKEPWAPDGFTCGLDPASNLDPQSWTNLGNLITDLLATGFTYIGLVPLPEGNTLDPSNWTGELGDRWTREANFLWNLRQLILSYHVPFGITFGGDGYFANTNPLMTQYAQTLWSWYTVAVNQQKDGWFSIPDNPDWIANIPMICKGLDQNGPVNWFPRFAIPCYGNGSWRSVYGDTCGILKALDDIGAPSEIPWEASESYSYADLTSAVELDRAVADNSRQCVGLFQWGILRDPSNPRADHNGNPTVYGLPKYLTSLS